MLVTSSITIDLTRKGFTQYLYATQDDGNTRAIEITLLADGQPWNIPASTSGAVSFKKPDKTSGLYDTLPDGATKAVTFVDNKLTAVLAPQVLTAAGDVDVSIALYDPSLNRLGTFPLVLRVEKNPSAGQGISNDYYNFQTLAELNEALGGHIHNNSNPHGVTAEQVGAAPAGYGLGVAQPRLIGTIDELDACREGGFYRYGILRSSVANVPVNFGSLIVYPVYTDTCVQELRPIITNYMMRRYWDGGKGEWGEWEIDNPPMELEVEYRTTERWMGKPVYTKLSNVGTTESAGGKHFSAPNIDKLIRIVPNVDGYTPMEWDSSGTGASANNSFYFLPERISSGVDMYVVCGANRVGKPLYVQAWYTKV